MKAMITTSRPFQGTVPKRLLAARPRGGKPDPAMNQTKQTSPGGHEAVAVACSASDSSKVFALNL